MRTRPILLSLVMVALALLAACTPAVPGGSERPSWAAGARSFDSVTGLYNASARNLSQWRAVRGAALAGVGQAHVSVVGDSIAAHMWTAPAETGTWPGMLKQMLADDLGSGGSGIVVPWRDLPIPGSSEHEPRISVAEGTAPGFVRYSPHGLHGAGAMAVHDTGAVTSFIRFEPTEPVDEVWVYAIGTGHRSRVVVDETERYELGAFLGDAGGTEGWDFIPAEPGFAGSSDPEGGGLRVFRIPVEPGMHSVKITGDGVGSSIIVGVEGRRVGGVRVSNLSLGGVSLAGLLLDNDEAKGARGLPLAFDTPDADLAIVALHVNDWLNHRDVADFKEHLATVVKRQRAAGPTAAGGTGADGDVLLVLNAQPDFTRQPPDQVQTPALEEYYATVYEVADELDVPLLDNAWRWTDYATSQDLFRDDGIHPNQKGAADIAHAVYNALMVV